MRRVYKNLCPATVSASIMATNMWKNSLKKVECDNNKILYETLLDFFLKRNGTYFLNKPRTYEIVLIFPFTFDLICKGAKTFSFQTLLTESSFLVLFPHTCFGPIWLC